MIPLGPKRPMSLTSLMRPKTMTLARPSLMNPTRPLRPTKWMSLTSSLRLTKGMADKANDTTTNETNNAIRADVSVKAVDSED